MSRLKNSKSVGRLVIDLDQQLELGANSKINLKDGDKLHIPATPTEVSVMGEVQFPTSHLHKPGLTEDGYIGLSGGFTQECRLEKGFCYKVKWVGNFYQRNWMVFRCSQR